MAPPPLVLETLRQEEVRELPPVLLVVRDDLRAGQDADGGAGVIVAVLVDLAIQIEAHPRRRSLRGGRGGGRRRRRRRRRRPRRRPDDDGALPPPVRRRQLERLPQRRRELRAGPGGDRHGVLRHRAELPLML